MSTPENYGHVCRRAGVVGKREAAMRIGMSYAAFERALQRARRAGAAA